MILTKIKKTIKVTSIFAAAFLLTSCINNASRLTNVELHDKWINPAPDEGVSFDHQLQDFDFYIAFKAISGDLLPASNCYDLEFINPHKLKDSAYSDWRKLTATCKSAKAYFKSSEHSQSYWPDTFAHINLSKFPASALPFIGKENLKNLRNNQPLITINNKLNVNSINENTQSINSDELTIEYTLLARGDFNNDRIEDLFIRLDWNLQPDNFQDTDWIVVTKRSKESKPYLLWRD